METLPYSKGKDCIQDKISKANRRFSLIGLTPLNGQLGMCIVIIQGIRHSRAVEVGIDISVQPDGDTKFADFFLKNAGPGKYFPRGPVCHFRGKDVPTLIRCSDSGSISSEIPAFGWSSKSPPALVTSIYQPSRNNLVVCVGVTYGTAM